MNYDVFGPFKVERDRRLINKTVDAKRSFWAAIEESAQGLPDAVGCYMFCIGGKPWYVGLAERQSFRGECFQPHKINAFNSALNNSKRGQPTLLFIAKRTNTGRFAKPGVNGHKSTRFLEDMLIGMALANNPLLENIKGTAMIKELVVPGILNTPRGYGRKTPVKFLQSILQA